MVAAVLAVAAVELAPSPEVGVAIAGTASESTGDEDAETWTSSFNLSLSSSLSVPGGLDSCMTIGELLLGKPLQPSTSSPPFDASVSFPDAAAAPPTVSCWLLPPVIVRTGALRSEWPAKSAPRPDQPHLISQTGSTVQTSLTFSHSDDLVTCKSVGLCAVKRLLVGRKEKGKPSISSLPAKLRHAALHDPKLVAKVTGISERVTVRI